MCVLFEVLAKENLTVNLVKSDFCFISVEYFSHKVGLVTPIMVKVEAIAKFLIPKNKKELMQFLGMIYRKLHPYFCSVVIHLLIFFTKMDNFKWTIDGKKLISKNKSVLISSPVLPTSDFSKQFKLSVDASDVGIGVALFHEHIYSLNRVFTSL